MVETASKYNKKLASTLKGGFTPACINDAEISPSYGFTPWLKPIFAIQQNICLFSLTEMNDAITSQLCWCIGRLKD